MTFDLCISASASATTAALIVIGRTYFTWLLRLLLLRMIGALFPYMVDIILFMNNRRTRTFNALSQAITVIFVVIIFIIESFIANCVIILIIIVVVIINIVYP